MSDDLYAEPRRPRGPSEEELAKQQRARFWRNVVISVVAAVVALLLGGVAYTVFQIRFYQVSGHKTVVSAADAATASKRATNRIEDCTTPGRDCYEQAQRQAGVAVAGVNTVTIRVAACVKKLPDTSQLSVADIAGKIKACVRRDRTTVKAKRLPQATVPGQVLTPKEPAHPRQPRVHQVEPPATPQPSKHHPSPSPGTPSPSPSPSCLQLPMLPGLCIPNLPLALPTL